MIIPEPVSALQTDGNPLQPTNATRGQTAKPTGWIDDSSLFSVDIGACRSLALLAKTPVKFLSGRWCWLSGCFRLV